MPTTTTTTTMRHQLLRSLAVGTVALATHGLAIGQTLLRTQPIPSLGLPIQGMPNAAFAADLDADGDDDWLVGEGNTLVILRQQGGTFARQPISSASLLNPALLSAGDVDGDGFADIVTGVAAQIGPSYLRIWWGDGSGTFPTASPTDVAINAALNTGPLVTGDVDADGDVDMILHGNPAFGAIASSLLRNLGNRQFTTAPAAQFPNLDTGNATPFLVDVDGDGARDVVWVSRDARTRLFWNNGGNFAEATTAQFPLLQRSLRGLAVADFDGDGDRDLVLGGDGEAGILIRTTGPRQLAIDSGAATGIRTVALRTADTDGDGDMDLHVIGIDHDESWSNDGTGVFSELAEHGTDEDVQFVAFGDLDDDGDLDHVRFGRTYALTGPLPPSITAAYEVTPGQHDYVGGTRLPGGASLVGSSSHGDIDGDGHLDLAAHYSTTQGSTLQFVRGSSEGIWRCHWANRVGGLDNGVFIDLTGDGRDELVFLGLTPSYLLNTDGQLATTPTSLNALPIGQFSAVCGLDLDGDGDTDLVFAVDTGAYSLLRVLMNHGGTFADESVTRVVGPFATGSYPAIRAADFDGDQDEDVWLHTSDQQHIWRNQGGTLAFVPAAIPISGWGNQITGSSMGDFDNDGDIDLHVRRKVFFNHGNGTFLPLTTVANSSYADVLRFAVDIDDDGDLDLLGSGLAMWNNGTGVFSEAVNVLPFVAGTGEGLRRVLDIDLDGDPDAISFANNQTKVLVNQLRQLRREGPALLGGQLDLRYVTSPGSTPMSGAMMFALSFATVAPTWLPDVGWVQIDVTQFSVLGPYLLPAGGGEISHLVPIPSTTTLRGQLVATQAVDLRGSRLRIGNLVSTLLGR